MDKELTNIHVGETLTEDFLEPLGWSPDRLAEELRVPCARVEAVVRGQEPVNAELAHRLARLFNLEAAFWLRLQNRYDLEAALTPELTADLAQITPRPTVPVPGEADGHY